MTLPTLNSFSLNNHVERSVAHRMWQCDMDELFFIDSIGGTNAGRSKFGITTLTSEKIEWRTIGDRPTSTTIVGSVSQPTTTGDDAYGNPVYATYGTITVANAAIFTPTMVLEIVQSGSNPPEFVHIDSINYGTNALSVTRGWRGSPVYSYSNGQVVTVMTLVAEECATPYFLRPLGLADPDKNYFQILTAGWEDTLKRQTLMKYDLHNGDAYDPYEEEMRRLLGGSVRGRNYTGLLPKLLERTALYGIPAPSGPNGDASMGGLNSFPINQLVTSTWDLSYLRQQIAFLYSQGADINKLVMMISPNIAELISTWGEGVYTTQRSENKVGIKIETIVTQYGEITPKIHRDLRPGEIYLYDPDKIGMIEGWGWTEEELPSDTALCEKHQIHGCYTMAVACPKHHMRIRVTGNGLPAPVFDRNPAPADTSTLPEEHGVVAA